MILLIIESFIKGEEIKLAIFQDTKELSFFWQFTASIILINTSSFHSCLEIRVSITILRRGIRHFLCLLNRILTANQQFSISC
jgi:hypothetical protein